MESCTVNGLNWMSSCSLVIRAFNEEQHIGRLLEGVRHQTVPDVQLIMVDSGLLTPDLRQTFYYQIGWEKTTPVKRDVEPIRYNE